MKRSGQLTPARLFTWAVGVLVAFVCTGPTGAIAALVAAVLVETDSVAPRTLILLGAGLLLLTPLLWIVGNLGRMGTASIAMVQDVRLPHHIVIVALVWVGAGVWSDSR